MEIKFSVNGQNLTFKKPFALWWLVCQIWRIFSMTRFDIVEEKSEAIFSSKGQERGEMTKAKRFGMPSTKKARERRQVITRTRLPTLQHFAEREDFKIKRQNRQQCSRVFEYTAPYAQYHQSEVEDFQPVHWLTFDNSNERKDRQGRTEKKSTTIFRIFGRQV